MFTKLISDHVIFKICYLYSYLSITFITAFIEHYACTFNFCLIQSTQKESSLVSPCKLLFNINLTSVSYTFVCANAVSRERILCCECFPTPSQTHRWQTSNWHLSQKMAAISVSWSVQNASFSMEPFLTGLRNLWCASGPRFGWKFSRHCWQYATQHCSQYQAAVDWEFSSHRPQDSVIPAINTSLLGSSDNGLETLVPGLHGRDRSKVRSRLLWDFVIFWLCISWYRKTMFSKARFLGSFDTLLRLIGCDFLHDGQSNPEMDKQNLTVNKT